jgi:hypothetical protein
MCIYMYIYIYIYIYKIKNNCAFVGRMITIIRENARNDILRL